jgi:dinuclear metal center YbgI/SA1388 family protein
MEKIAPTHLAESWDNVGLLVGDSNAYISKLLLALDATDEVIDEAIKVKANLIITHHPILFKPVKSVTTSTLNGRLYKLIQNNISVYAAHTNFDIASGGTSDILAEKLNLKQIDVLEPTVDFENKTYGIGRIGTLQEETTFLDFIKILKEVLGLKRLNVVGDLSKKIKKVALSTGSGSEYLEQAYKKGADVYISGDVKYHDAQIAQELGICWVDATHYASENLAMPILKQYLEQEFSLKKLDVEIFVSEINGQPFVNI